jgi:hypothetical protein
MTIEDKTVITPFSGSLETIEKIFRRKVENINNCIYSFFEENETYDWCNIKKKLIMQYNGLPQILKNKYQQEYDNITMTIEDFSNVMFNDTKTY